LEIGASVEFSEQFKQGTRAKRMDLTSEPSGNLPTDAT
jgi:hypothetical protein